MGLFAGILGMIGIRGSSLTQQEAVAGILITAVFIDGDVSEEEKVALYGMLGRLKLFSGITTHQYLAILKKLQPMLSKNGHQVVLKRASEVLPMELKESVFALATDLIFADGKVGDREGRLLDEMRDALGIPEPTAVKIVEVMIIKNRG